jgi:outer membrane protease
MVKILYKQNNFSKMLRILSKLLCLFFLFGTAHVAYSQDFRKVSPVQFSLQPSLGYKTGSIGEHLFNMDNYGKLVEFAPGGGRQISFLQWDIHSMLLAELEVALRYKRFHAQMTGEVGIPMRVGKMDDYDWNTTKGHQTHFSTHHNALIHHFALGGLLGWEFSPENKQLTLTPLIGFSWQRTFMMAYDGYRQYVPTEQQETTPWSDDIEKKYFTGNVISYEHEVFQIDCIFRITYNHSPRLHFTVEGSIHPIIAAFGYDTHILRDLQFLDHNMKGNIGFGTSFGMGYQMLPKMWFICKLDYNYMPVIVGQTYMKNVNERYYYPDSSSRGGASHWFVGVTLGCKFNLFQ